jgi:hypothetical protein
MEITKDIIKDSMNKCEEHGFLRCDPNFRVHAIWCILMDVEVDELKTGHFPRRELAQELEKFFFPEAM